MVAGNKWGRERESEEREPERKEGEKDERIELIFTSPTNTSHLPQDFDKCALNLPPLKSQPYTIHTLSYLFIPPLFKHGKLLILL